MHNLTFRQWLKEGFGELKHITISKDTKRLLVCIIIILGSVIWVIPSAVTNNQYLLINLIDIVGGIVQFFMGSLYLVYSVDKVD